jgi:hypothetical protein
MVQLLPSEQARFFWMCAYNFLPDASQMAFWGYGVSTFSRLAEEKIYGCSAKTGPARRYYACDASIIGFLFVRTRTRDQSK